MMAQLWCAPRSARREAIDEELPQRRARLRLELLALHLIAEAVHRREGGVLVVSAEEIDLLRERELEEQERGQHLHAMRAAVDKVAVEDDRTLRLVLIWVALSLTVLLQALDVADAEDAAEALERAVQVADDVDRSMRR